MKDTKGIKVYRIAGLDWSQDEILYPDWGKALELLKEFEDYFKGESTTFGSVAGSIYKAGLAPKLFRLVLKPHLPDWKARLKYLFYHLMGRIDRENLTETLTLPEIFAVIADFFFINTQWIESLMSSGSESDTKALTLIQAVLGSAAFPLRRSSSSSPRETSADSKPQNVSSGPDPQQPSEK